MKNKYGFSQLMITVHYYGSARNAGFEDNQILIRTRNTANLNDYLGDISDSRSASVLGFYSDEPFENCNYDTRDTLRRVLTSLADLIYPKILVMGSWSLDYVFSTSYGYVLDRKANTFIMCDEYKRSGGSMQSFWEDFKEAYDEQNISNFMDVGMQNPNGTSPNFAHWDGLIPCARNSCNLNSIYLYSDNNGNGDNVMNNFCYYAWQNYYLKGFGRNVTITERCISPNCQHCQDPDDPEGEQYWFIESIIIGDIWYEVFP